MWNKCAGWFIMIILFDIVIGEDCPPGIDSNGNRLSRIHCELYKRFTFGPWSGKRSSNTESLESSRYQRDFSSWGGKRFEDILLKTNDKDQTEKKYESEILSCIKRFTNDQFFLARCVELVQNDCKAHDCSEDLSGIQRREFSSWGG